MAYVLVPAGRRIKRVARLAGNDVSAGPAGPGRILDAVRLLLPRFIRLCSSALSLVFFFCYGTFTGRTAYLWKST